MAFNQTRFNCRGKLSQECVLWSRELVHLRSMKRFIIRISLYDASIDMAAVQLTLFTYNIL